MQKIVRKNSNIQSIKNKQNIDYTHTKSTSPSRKLLLSKPIFKQCQQQILEEQEPSKIISKEENLMALLFQYKLVQTYGPLLGIYCIPNSEDCYVWSCIVFVREGYYKNGKFKFDLLINRADIDYQPKILFKIHLFHPIVDQVTGEVDMNFLLQRNNKTSAKHTIYAVLRSVQKMFIDQQILSNRKSFNQIAGKIFVQKNDFFISKALKSIQEDKLIDDNGETSGFYQSQVDNNQLVEEFRQKLKQISLNDSLISQKKAVFCQFVQSKFCTLLQKDQEVDSNNSQSRECSQISFRFQNQQQKSQNEGETESAQKQIKNQY